MKRAIFDGVLVLVTVAAFYFGNKWLLDRRDKRHRRTARDRYIGRS